MNQIKAPERIKTSHIASKIIGDGSLACDEIISIDCLEQCETALKCCFERMKELIKGGHS